MSNEPPSEDSINVKGGGFKSFLSTIYLNVELILQICVKAFMQTDSNRYSVSCASGRYSADITC